MRRLTRLLLVLALLGAGTFAMRLLGDGHGEIAGTARVVDGDTLAIGTHRIRLHGVDAPEARQACDRAGEPWRCGADASAALRALVDGQQVDCTPVDRDRYGRVVARCHAGGQDIGGWMVRHGLAVAYTEYTLRYLPDEWLAWAAGRGIWAGDFETPSDYRRDHRR